jgi:transcriptional regulator with XRE-family HTH domain
MAKFEKKIVARKLRKEGKSINDISKMIGVSKSTASQWCNDIFLSSLQKINLKNTSLIKARKGSLIANENRKKERICRLNFYKIMGINKVGYLSKRDLFLVGIALYWAEGDKKQRRVVFINSDPKMILLWIMWVNNCLKINNERLICRVEINEKHYERLDDISNYWSVTTNIPLSQFRKASIKHVKTNKFYENNLNYYGSLQITVKKGTNTNYEILGYIEGLARSIKHDKI